MTTLLNGYELRAELNKLDTSNLNDRESYQAYEAKVEKLLERCKPFTLSRCIEYLQACKELYGDLEVVCASKWEEVPSILSGGKVEQPSTGKEYFEYM